jgi:hypothetical protein
MKNVLGLIMIVVLATLTSCGAAKDVAESAVETTENVVEVSEEEVAGEPMDSESSTGETMEK